MSSIDVLRSKAERVVQNYVTKDELPMLRIYKAHEEPPPITGNPRMVMDIVFNPRGVPINEQSDSDKQETE